MELHNSNSAFFDQLKDLVWTVNHTFELVFGNKAYLDMMKEVRGTEMKPHESVLIDSLGKEYTERWKTYYNRALEGNDFEIEERFYNQVIGRIQHNRVTFTPVVDEQGEIMNVVCQAHDIANSAQQLWDSRHLMNASPDTFCTINEAGNIVFVSADSEALWGYLPEELIGNTCADFLVEEDLVKTKELLRAIINGENINTFQNRFRKKDGEVAYNLWSARWNDSEKLMYCVVRNGRETIEREEILTRSEQRFKSLVQDGYDLIGIIDQDGNYNYVSPTSQSVLGIAPEEFIGRNAFDFIHPDDQAITLASLQRIATEVKIQLKPYRFQNNKKEWRWMETILTNMTDNPAVKGIVANSRDITDKVAEEQKLQLFQKVIDSTIDSIMITEAAPLDEPGPKIVYVNQAFETQTGYSAEEVIGKNPRFLQGVDSDRAELTLLGEKLRRHESCEITVLNYKKSGEAFWSNFIVSPIADKNGLLTHFISVQRDVTEQKNRELEQRLTSEISRVFNDDEDLSTTVKRLCERINTVGQFTIIEFWSPNVEKTELRHLGHYATNEDFYLDEVTKSIFKKGHGLPGKVWKEKKTLLWDEEEIRKHFVRKESVAKLGVKAILGVPLTYKEDIIGVLLIGTKRGCDYLTKYGQILSRLQGLIGSEINRKQLEYDLKFLYNAIPDIICITDFNGRFLKMNTAGCDLLGYTQEEVLFRNFNDFLHPDDANMSEQGHSELTSGSNLEQFENRYITKSGNVIWISWSCSSDVNRGLIYASGKNITETKLLRELNEQASKLSKIGAWEIDLEHSTIYWSEMVHQLHETDPHTFIPDFTSGINFYREDYRLMVHNQIENCIATGIDFDYEAVLVTNGLNEKWVHAIGSLEKINGKPYRLYGSLQDITDRKESEIRLIAAQERFEKVTEATNDGIWDWDLASNELYVGGGFKSQFGFYANSENPTLKSKWNNIHSDDIDRVEKSFYRALDNSETHNWVEEYRYRKSDNTYVYVMDKGIIMRDLNSTPLRVVGAMKDLTHQKRTELELLDLNKSLNKYASELERSNEELEQFAFVTSHDLQEPLRMITSFMDLLKRNYGDRLDAKAHQYIHFATDGAKRMKQIILDLLIYSRANKPGQDLGVADLNKILTDFQQLRKHVLAEKSVTIHADKLPILHTHKTPITQIFHCLLDNAIKYAKKDVAPIIEIQALEKPDEWEFRINDNGIGIESRFFEKIFGIFQRLHNRDHYEGTGIGLSVVKRSVEFLGGRIWLTSTVGEGSTFYFTITKHNP